MVLGRPVRSLPTRSHPILTAAALRLTKRRFTNAANDQKSCWGTYLLLRPPANVRRPTRPCLPIKWNPMH